MSQISPNLKTRIKAIKLIITDIDGVFNDGNIFFDANGTEVMKSFHAQDSIGIRLIYEQTALQLAVISGRQSDIVFKPHALFWRSQLSSWTP